MKLQENNFEVEVQGSEDSQDFSVAMNGKAFRVLSSGLYQDKIGSIIREICSNAYDAHVMAGCPEKPFELHLPDAFEPWFAVKDFGVGLSDTDIKVVFTRYFESTKESNNDTIGAFGLGAKSPFSYTDQFSVVSNHNGTQTVYSAYLKACGTPTISRMLQSPTTEGNGVEIKMAVKQNDILQFAQKAAEQLRYFKVLPIVTNSPSSFRGIPKEYEGKELQLQTKICRLYSGGSGITLIQGNVGYPLNIQQYRSMLSGDPNDLTGFINALWNSGTVAMDFPIGEISVTASRESLEYTERTCANISKALLEIKAEVGVIYDAELKACKNNWEVACVVNKSSSLVKYADLSKYAKTNEAEITNRHGNKGFEIPVANGIQTWNTSYRSSALKTTFFSGFFLASNDTVIYTVEDTTKYKRNRLKQLVGYNCGVYCINAADTAIYSKLLGGFNNFKKLEDQPFTKPVRTPSGPKTQYYTVEQGGYYGFTLNKATESFKDEYEGVPFILIPQHRGSLTYSGEQVVQKLKILEDFVDVPVMLAASDTVAEKLKKLDNFVDYEKFLVDSASTLKANLGVMQKRFNANASISTIDLRFVGDAFSGTKLHKLAKLRAKLQTYCENNNKYKQLLKIELNPLWTTAVKEVIQEYPILKASGLLALKDEELARYLRV